MHYELLQLRYFLAIAERGSISAAAAQFGVAQPSVSAVVKRLEATLGVKLFLRGARGVQLTTAGATLSDRARQIVDMLDIAIADVQKLGTLGVGKVAIGLSATLLRVLGVPLSERMHGEFPQISLKITEAASQHVLDMLLSGQLDVACLLEGQDFSQVVVEPLFTEELFLVSAPKSLPDFVPAVGAIEFSSLGKLPLVLASRPNGLRAVLDHQARRYGVDLQSKDESDSLLHIVAMVKKARGHTILPASSVAEAVRNGELQLRPIVKPTISRTVYFAWHRNRAVTSTGEALKTIIKEIVHEATLRGDLPSQDRMAPNRKRAAGAA